ncbi:MAG: hypothetical protein R3C59_28395 [Planctomycetaceae bacterium]
MEHLTAQDSWSVLHARTESSDELLTWDPFEDWEKSSAPGWRAKDEIGLALKCALGGDVKRAILFAKRSLAVAIRAVKEHSTAHWPSSLPDALVSRIYATFILKSPLTNQLDLDFVRAADLYYDVVKDHDRWMPIDESTVLESVQLYIVCREWSRATELLKDSRFSRESDITRVPLQNVLNRLEQGTALTPRDPFCERFDRIRYPGVAGETAYFNLFPDLISFCVLALMTEKPRETITFDEVIELVFNGLPTTRQEE